MEKRKSKAGFPGRPGPRGPSFDRPDNQAKVISHLMRRFRAEEKYFLFLFVSVMFSVAGGALAPVFQARAIDDVVSGNYGNLPRMLLAMGAMYFLYVFWMYITGRVSASLSQRIVMSLRSDLFSKIIHLPVSYIDNHPHGDLISRMTNDADNISEVISDSLSTLVRGIMTIIAVTVMMFMLNVPLTLLTLTTVLAAAFVTSFVTKSMRGYFKKRQVLLGKINSTVEEMVSGIRTLKAYNQELPVTRDFDTTADSLTKTGIVAEIIGGSMGPLMNMLGNAAFVIVSVFGAFFALKGYVTVGVISAFIIYARQFSRPVAEISQLYGQVETALAGAERIFEILEIPSETGGKDTVNEPVRGRVEFHHVTFSYVPGKPALKDFNLVLSPGKKIALVGATGSGKTTVINLLLRFYEADSGEILIDGKNIRNLTLKSLRKCFGVVLQDTGLFTGTVRYNLSYGSQNVSDRDLKTAARLSGADHVIGHLPDGYDTVLKDAGNGLSKGERQLMAIARAFVENPPVLIFDEATSSVDTKTEAKIQNAMTSLMEGRTSLIIAHRLSTIRNVDEIIVMDHGCIVERGSHEELLRKKGAYYNLYMKQFEGKQT